MLFGLDLVPAAHLAGWVGAIGRMYLDALSYQLDYHEDADDSLWMDTSRGVFCRGPEGPVWNVGVGFQLDDLPLDAELVKEDVLIRYLATTSVDRGVVKWLSQTYDYQVSRVRVNRPTVISTLNDTILAVESGDWRVHEDTCLGEKTELLYGTRFTLKENGCPLELGLDWEEAWCDWYAQAPSVFHAYGVSLEGDLKAYKLVLPEKLTGTLSQSKAKRQRRQKSSPIYLFLSMSTFWSFDQDGQTPIPADLCRRLGLPPWLSPETWEYTWRTSTYKALRDYQIARKFDPTTTNFAQHHGYRIYDVVKNPGLSGHFKEMDDSDPTESATAPQPREVHTESVHQTETELEDMSLGLPFGDPQREIDSHPDLKAQKYFGGFFFAVHRSVLVPSIAVELLANLRSGLQVRSWVAAIAH
ncbi:hypothetical protein V5O48_010994 [Marasmius crinis-equi]|uniref:Uncharacterized protein n=1 Tax=Marasmius crinis-equi TaxID=585013 RepID=A0ABR3F6T8_9AGAR